MKVKPIRVEKIALRDVQVGDIFTFDGKKYIKLAEDYAFQGSPCLSLAPIGVVNTVENLEASVEEKVINAYFSAVKGCDNANIVSFQIPDADYYRAYHRIIDKYIHDTWYVDNGERDILKGNEFMFVDAGNNLCQGIPSDIAIIQKVQNLNIRTLVFIELFAEVYIEV